MPARGARQMRMASRTAVTCRRASRTVHAKPPFFESEYAGDDPLTSLGCCERDNCDDVQKPGQLSARSACEVNASAKN